MESKRIFGFLIFVFCLSGIVSYPTVDGDGDTYDPELAADKDEGDMILTDAQKKLLYTKTQGRNGLIAEESRWPDKTVVYKITGDFGADQLMEIDKAIDLLEQETCVRFRKATDADISYVAIKSAPAGCFSAVGYQNEPAQPMNLEAHPVGEGCFRFGSVLHEFMHVLGFYHEHSSADRDDYVQVHEENIQTGKDFNFYKYSSTVVTDFGIGYDYDSCLHYRTIAFSKNGEETIVPRDPTAKIGQRISISSKDLQKINVMYKCPIKI